ncbi:MAG: cytochrome C [Kiritimatiellales bacterium]|nr:NapC/NirT family cytochrome c [Pontiella sp.]NNJ69764.1 cytochrome C [Kiritimatiellales bacterium]
MENAAGKRGLIYNLTSLVGMVLTALGFIVGSVLLIIDARSHFDNPYTGIFTYMVVPAILISGLLLILVGVLRERRRRISGKASERLPVINLNDRRQFISLVGIIVVTLCFIAISVVGSYRAYHFTESVEFCGKTCHSVMKPEYTAYQNSPHANAGCTKCHIGPGADFFVKAKLNGLYQVYSTIFNKYNRPIPAPVHNLRPAKETCYTCHWPEKFFGATELKRTYFRADEENSPWTIHMLLKVGGGNAEINHPEGIHWHVTANNKIEYIAADEQRLDIPWIRMTDEDGNQTIFQTSEKSKQLTPEQIASSEIRTMDCIDCHNRPTHQYHSPERALNDALANRQLNPDLSEIKANGIEALTGDYTTEGEALKAIEQILTDAYPEGGQEVEQAITAVQRIYSQNIFPEMKVSWKEYPDHIGHMITPGCFRCHNGDHQTEQGQTISRDCDSCHTIIAQGPGLNVTSINTGGLPFKHPEDIDEEWKETRCDECHEGVPVM